MEEMSIVPTKDDEVELAKMPTSVFEKPAPTDVMSHGKFSIFNMKANKKIYQNLVHQSERDRQYIAALEALLRERGIEVPATTDIETGFTRSRKYSQSAALELLPDAEYETLRQNFAAVAKLVRMDDVEVQYRDLSFWGMVPKTTIPTVGSTFKHMIFGSGPKHRTDILKGLTGRIRPRKMTLVMGPPGCGKSSLLKALAGQLAVGNKRLDGDLTYNGVKCDEGKFVLPKLTDYIDEKDQHAATLTVLETLEFAWRMSSNSKHSYSFAKDAEAAAIMDKDNEKLTKVCT